MGNLREWNEALARHFLKNQTQNAMLAVTETTITKIHQDPEFPQNYDDPMEDFLRALCHTETGYEDVLDSHPPVHTDTDGFNGWPEDPALIIRNAYELRRVANKHEYWDNGNGNPPAWTSHLALAVLATSMGPDLNPTRPGNSRYPYIADLLHDKMEDPIEDQTEDNLHVYRLGHRIQERWVDQFFGRIKSSRPTGYKADHVVAWHCGNKEDGSRIWKKCDPWEALHYWSKFETAADTPFKGTFKRIPGRISNPVTQQAMIREDDLNVIAGFLSDLDLMLPPSPQVLGTLIQYNRNSFNQRVKGQIENGNFRHIIQAAQEMYEFNMERILEAGIEDQPDALQDSEMGLYTLYVDLHLIDNGEDLNPKIWECAIRLRHNTNKRPESGVIHEVEGTEFCFLPNQKDAVARLDGGLDECISVLNSTGHVPVTVDGETVGYAATVHYQVIERNEDCHMVADLYGIFFNDPHDERSGGWRLSRTDTNAHPDLQALTGFDLRLTRQNPRPPVADEQGFGSTKISLFGGAVATGGHDRLYYAEGLPQIVLKRGNSNDVVFLDGEEGDHATACVSENWATINRKELKLLTLHEDFSVPAEHDEGQPVRVVVPFRYTWDENSARRNLRFSILLDADHWQVHPTEHMEDLPETPPPTFDLSVFALPPPPCIHCASVSHPSEQCPDLCGICGTFGHSPTECPDRPGCRHCSSLEHHSDACPSVCGHCKRPGHEPQFCTTKRCTSCGTPPVGANALASMPCPSCFKEDFSRCGRCRSNGVIYVCRRCGFEGP